MATIFLSYRRTDSPQACRVYEYLTRRFGNDAVFMDVEAIPFAVSFPDHIRQSIAESSILVALIGDRWQEKLERDGDPVRLEIEAAIASNIPVLPVLIGTTPMPDAETLPASIASIASRNASTVGVSRDFDTHMRALVPKIEAILGALSSQNVVTADEDVVSRACEGVNRFLMRTIPDGGGAAIRWEVANTATLSTGLGGAQTTVTLFLHRVARLAELLELHFILSFWAYLASDEQRLAGVVMRQFEQTPVIPDEFLLGYQEEPPPWGLKIRHSDEDARQVWKMITDRPLQLSLAYIATVSPKPAGQESGDSLAP